MRAKRTLLMGLIASGAAMAANPAKDAVPLFFIENQGQAPSSVRFMAKGSGVTAWFSAGEARFRMAGASVRLEFEGANPAALVEGMDRLPSHANFLIGATENWRVDVPTYRAIRYRELYPGIDMTYGGIGLALKSEFVVAPGADTARIRMRYLGTGDLRIEESGELVIPLSARESARKDGGQGARELREQAPILYQEYNGKRVPVDGRFVLLDGHGVGFMVGKYDLARPLVIDPVLSYSTLLGGSGSDAATSLAVDSAGSAYVAGFTDSFDLPATSPEQNFNAGGNDAFVAKLNPSGNGLVYCTYLGGRGDDRAYGVAVDASGSAYIAGSTTSTNFPVRNALQSSLAGGRNAFVARLNPAGNTLVFSTYLGGNGSDTSYGVALDGSGNAYIVGDTTSSNFPASGVQRGYHGAQDAFVAKLAADGSRLVYSTYLGGGDIDHGTAIAVDSGGSAYVTGYTWSTDFPAANAFQSAIAGGQDAFLARLSADGNTLLFSTWLGGSRGTVGYPEAGLAIALDGQGNAYVTGVTSSPDFPSLHALQSALRGFTDAFVSKVSASGVLAYSTYLGGAGLEVGNAIVVDAGGSAYVAGYTSSTDLPVVNAIQPGLAGEYDAFLACLSPAGDSLSYLSYLGGNHMDTATALALDGAGAVYIAGWTLSSNFPLLNPYQSTNAGNYGAFVTKMVLSTVAGPPVLSVTKTHNGSFTQGQIGAAYSVTVSNGAGAGATSGTVTVTELIPTGFTLVSMSGTGWTCGGAACTRSDALAGGGSYPPVTVAVSVASNAPSLVTNQVSVIGGGSASASATNPATIAVGCSYSLSPTGTSMSFNSGTGTLVVTPSAGCPWAAASNASWLTVTSGAAGSGTGTVGYWFAANPNGTPRSGTLTIGGRTFTITQAAVTVSGPQALRFVPVAPCRIADTRNPTGPFGGPALGISSSRDFTIPASPCGIPANALAYSLNLTIVPLGPLGFLQVFPSGQGQPSVSTLNSGDGRVKANAAIVPAGLNGAVTLFASDPTHVIVDINGYFVPASGAQNLAFYPIAPCRLADTRGATGNFGGPVLAATTSRDFPVLSGPCGIPASARAYAFNMSVVPTGPLGFLSAWPAGNPQPGSSTLNAPTGTVTANMAIVPAGAGGAITVIATNATHLIIDITGYFAPPGAARSLDFYTANPCRILDTRGATGAFGGPAMGAVQSRSFLVPSSGCGIPATAKAYSLNATVVPPTPLGFLTLWGSGSLPSASALNSYDGTIVANAAVVPAGTNGAVTAFTSNLSHLILDINGYFQ